MSLDAMKQALEALEKAHIVGGQAACDQAITALRLAIEQAERQEPVGEVLNERGDVDYLSYVPPAGTPLYTAPPQRQPLTDEEAEALVEDVDWYNYPADLIRATERAHGIGDGE